MSEPEGGILNAAWIYPSVVIFNGTALFDAPAPTNVIASDGFGNPEKYVLFSAAPVEDMEISVVV